MQFLPQAIANRLFVDVYRQFNFTLVHYIIFLNLTSVSAFYINPSMRRWKYRDNKKKIRTIWSCYWPKSVYPESCCMTKVKEETGEYTSVHSSNLHIDFPRKMRYSWGNGVVRRGNRGWSVRSRYARPIWIESRLRHAISTEEVEKEKNLTGKQERKETGRGKGRSVEGEREKKRMGFR